MTHFKWTLSFHPVNISAIKIPRNEQEILRHADTQLCSLKNKFIARALSPEYHYVFFKILKRDNFWLVVELDKNSC